LKVAVISDTHDRLSKITRVVEMLNQMDIDLVVHCGDYSAPFAVKPYANLKPQMIGIYGNNDAEKSLIASHFKQIGKELRGEFGKITLGKKEGIMIHGHNNELLEALIESNAFDIIFYGHTHQSRIELKDDTLILNPGEVCGYLTGESTFAVLETKTLKTEILPIR
jgi:putative phosphoesterase